MKYLTVYKEVEVRIDLDQYDIERAMKVYDMGIVDKVEARHDLDSAACFLRENGQTALASRLENIRNEV